jgi:hypothetical protein
LFSRVVRRLMRGITEPLKPGQPYGLEDYLWFPLGHNACASLAQHLA